MDVRRILILTGIAPLAAGLLWPLLSRLGLGRLPGDIAIEREFVLPVIVITGRSDPALRLRAQAAGALAVFDKPVDEEQLLGAIEGAWAH